MKKGIGLILILVMVLCQCSCSLIFGRTGIFDNNKEQVNEQFDGILQAMESEDKDAFATLFSKTTIDGVEAFDASVDALFDYFSGEVESYDDWAGPTVSTSKDEDEILQIIDATYDVKTTEGAYRFAIRYISIDTANADNVGIQSLYIIKAEDDPKPDYAYWGDGKYTPGVHINIPRAN